jgi:hypothetical protein
MAALSLIMSASTYTAHAQTVQAQVATSAAFKPHIPITSLPLTITTPGYYFLLSDISFTPTSMSNRIAITVSSPNVTIDLRGYSLSGPGQAFITLPEDLNLNPEGIAIHSSNVIVKNGTISGFFFQLDAGPSGTDGQTYLDKIAITNVKFTEGGDQSINLGLVNNAIVSNCSFGPVPEPAVIDAGSQTGNRYINDSFSGSSNGSFISIISRVPMILNTQPKANASRD